MSNKIHLVLFEPKKVFYSCAELLRASLKVGNKFYPRNENNFGPLMSTFDMLNSRNEEGVSSEDCRNKFC